MRDMIYRRQINSEFYCLGQENSDRDVTSIFLKSLKIFNPRRSERPLMDGWIYRNNFFKGFLFIPFAIIYIFFPYYPS